MKKVGLYGGSFDPPHIGHIMNITAVVNSKLVDEVWLVPAGRHRFKQSAAPAEHRRIMVEIMLATVFGPKAPVYLDTTELDEPSVPSKTIDLVTRMRARHADCEFALVIGSDLIEQIPYWERGTELLASTPFLVVPRLGHSILEGLPTTMSVVPTDYRTDVSSSTVRAMIAKGLRLDGILPPGVIAHILRNRLYKDPA